MQSQTECHIDDRCDFEVFWRSHPLGWWNSQRGAVLCLPQTQRRLWGLHAADSTMVGVKRSMVGFFCRKGRLSQWESTVFWVSQFWHPTKIQLDPRWWSWKLGKCGKWWACGNCRGFFQACGTKPGWDEMDWNAMKWIRTISDIICFLTISPTKPRIPSPPWGLVSDPGLGDHLALQDLQPHHVGPQLTRGRRWNYHWDGSRQCFHMDFLRHFFLGGFLYLLALPKESILGMYGTFLWSSAMLECFCQECWLLAMGMLPKPIRFQWSCLRFSYAVRSRDAAISHEIRW